MSTLPKAWRPPTDAELDEMIDRSEKVALLISAGVHTAEAEALQQDLEDIKAGRPLKPSVRAPAHTRAAAAPASTRQRRRPKP